MPDMVCPYCGKPVTSQAAAAGRCAACKADISWRFRPHTLEHSSGGAERAVKKPATATTARWQDSWWNYCLWGLLFPVIGILIYFYFDTFENSQDASRHLWAPIALLYAIGGKWIFPMLFSLFGVLTFVAGVRRSR